MSLETQNPHQNQTPWPCGHGRKVWWANIHADVHDEAVIDHRVCETSSFQVSCRHSLSAVRCGYLETSYSKLLINFFAVNFEIRNHSVLLGIDSGAICFASNFLCNCCSLKDGLLV